MFRAIIIVFGAFTLWVFWRNFFWPWLSNQIFFWRYARTLRKTAKDIRKIDKPDAERIAKMVDELVQATDERRKNNKL